MIGHKARTLGVDGARPRAEWVEYGGVSAASAMGWTEKAKPWWDGMPTSTYAHTVAQMSDPADLSKITHEMRVVQARLVQQTVGKPDGHPNGPVAKAKYVMAAIALKRRIAGARIQEVIAGSHNAKCDELVKMEEAARLMVEVEEAIKEGEPAIVLAHGLAKVMRSIIDARLGYLVGRAEVKVNVGR